MPDAKRGRLAEYTTLRLGGPADRIVEATSAEAIAETVRDTDRQGTPLLVMAGGSNLVIADEGFPGTALLLRSTGVEVHDDGDHVEVTVQAGHSWDALVARAVTEGWSGIECLSGIPGSVGATPIQNVGAYGQEISETFRHLHAFDRRTGQTVTFTGPECRFAYRDSIFKHDDRYVVLDVTYRLRRSDHSGPIRYAETAKALGVEAGQTAPLALVRDTVLKLRRGKGMVLDQTDHDTFSAGSFFINPVITGAEFEGLCARSGTTPPHWPAGDDVKVPAAWLIARAGFDKGYGHDGVSLSTKHPLALTNRGTGTTAALLALAAEVRDGVAAKLHVTLRPEPTLVGVHLGP